MHIQFIWFLLEGIQTNIHTYKQINKQTQTIIFKCHNQSVNLLFIIHLYICFVTWESNIIIFITYIHPLYREREREREREIV